jgi:predicted transcriptional regulator
MVNRDRHDIVIEILKKSVSGKRKTELMSEVGLSYSQAKQYLKRMVDDGFLVQNPENKYVVTKKGQNFVEKCSDCWLFSWEKQKR